MSKHHTEYRAAYQQAKLEQEQCLGSIEARSLRLVVKTLCEKSVFSKQCEDARAAQSAHTADCREKFESTVAQWGKAFSLK